MKERIGEDVDVDVLGLVEFVTSTAATVLGVGSVVEPVRGKHSDDPSPLGRNAQRQALEGQPIVD